MIAEYEVTNYIEPEEYFNMRLSVGWTAFPKEQAEEGIKNSAFVCCIRKEDKPIAMARVIWDHGYTVFILDVIVKPEYQSLQFINTNLFNSEIGIYHTYNFEFTLTSLFHLNSQNL